MSLYERVFLEEGRRLPRTALAIAGLVGLNIGVATEKLAARRDYQKYHSGRRVSTQPTPETGAVPEGPRAELAEPSRTELIRQKRARYKKEGLDTRRGNIRKWGHPEGEFKILPSGKRVPRTRVR